MTSVSFSWRQCVNAVAVFIAISLLMFCATYSERDLQNFNKQFQKDLPTSPRYKLESTTADEFLLTVHQGSALFSPGYVRANYLIAAAKVVAEDTCTKAMKKVSDFETQQSGDSGWVSIQARFKCTVQSAPAAAGGTESKPHSTRTGTGFFVSAEGHVLTAAHVVDGATRIRIVSNQKILNANVVHVDSANDLAVLKTEGACTALAIGSALDLTRATEVMTLGYPLIGLQGQEQKATFGRVNALSGIAGDVRYLQIDIPIQPGNSGGPLLTRDGRVVGVISATLNQDIVISKSGTIAQNVNYAVKVDYALPLLQGVQLVRGTGRASATRFEFTELVERSTASVVLVVAD